MQLLMLLLLLMQQQSKMVVFGLGNPGAKYSGTRHNVGFDTVERIAALKGMKLRKRCFRLYRRADLADLSLVEPLTYMNSSGDVVEENLKEGDTMVVIVDQMDLPPGRIRIRAGGGSAGHNGLKSIIAAHGPDFIRVYIGIGRPEPGTAVVDHVLTRFSPEDRALVDKAEEKAAEAVLRLYGGERLESVLQWANS